MKRILLAFALVFPLCAGTVAVTISGTGTGQTFRGIGGVSAGASSRTLLDYPAQQRGEILDFLFKPNYGAALTHLKVEIGGDENSTDGAEPSHERVKGSINCNRGYESALMLGAIARNSGVVLDSLMWGTAGWMTGSTQEQQFYSLDNVHYVEHWLTCMASLGLPISYTGAWNEPANNNPPWMELLGNHLIDDGFSTTTKLVLDDLPGGDEFATANFYNGTPELLAVSSTLDVHYPNYYNDQCSSSEPNYSADATTARTAHGAELWDSEDGFWFLHSNAGVANWTGAQDTAHFLNCNYLTQKIVKTELWALYSGYYDILALPGAGQLLANEPWTGHYVVTPVIWAIAHTAQFIQPGWTYIDSASGVFDGGGTYVFARSGTAYSGVIESRDASGSNTFNFTLTNGASTGTVHVWESTSSSQFIKQSDITPSGGTYSLTVAANTIYTITTTTGQAKGSTTPPSSAAFPFPYVDDFEGEIVSHQPKYLQDQEGSWEVANCTNGHAGNCARQVVLTAPVAWPAAPNQNHPFSIIGDKTWTDYIVQSDVLLETAGTANLFGRVNVVTQNATISGYLFQISNTGAWKLTSGYTIGTVNSTITSGTLGGGFGTNTWHTLQMKFTGTNIVLKVDGTQIASVTDSTYTAGMAALGTGSFINAQFDNFGACSTSGCPPPNSVPGGVTTYGGTTRVQISR